MLLSQLVEHMQGLMAEHGDHEVWIEDSYGNHPYDGYYFQFTEGGYDDIPANTYVI